MLRCRGGLQRRCFSMREVKEGLLGSVGWAASGMVGSVPSPAPAAVAAAAAAAISSSSCLPSATTAAAAATAASSLAHRTSPCSTAWGEGVCERGR